MEKRKLGTQGLEVSAIGLGCMSLTAAYGPGPGEDQALKLIHRAIDLGVTLFDTAEVYGRMTNEILVGKGLRNRRDKVVVATKFGFDVTDLMDSGRPRRADSRPERIKAVADASLQKLGIEVIDLFYQHRVDPNVPIEDVAGAVGDLVKAGKVRFFGLSEAGADTIRRAHAVHPVTALQTEYSLWSRDPERDVWPTLRELGIGFVPYSPLGRGFLAGSVTDTNALAPNDFRRDQPRLQGDALQSNLALVDNLKRLAQQKNRTPAQLALAWILHQRKDIVPIPGTSRVERLIENVAAADVELTASELADIEAAIPEGSIAGGRWDATGKAMVNL